MTTVVVRGLKEKSVCTVLVVASVAERLTVL